MAERNEVLVILKYMAENPGEPVGSGTVCQILEGAGYNVSEATVGRLLRDMDIKEYTMRLGFRGRVLTEEGMNFFQRKTREEERRRYSNQLAKLVRFRSKEDLLEILVARRAIEREIARLAAINITQEQAEALNQIMEQYPGSGDGSIAAGDEAFHRLLAEAAGNKVLKAALDLIRQDGQLSPVLEYIRTKVQGRILSDHNQICRAVLARDAAGAERAMEQHIESLICDVEKYWTLATHEE